QSNTISQTFLSKYPKSSETPCLGEIKGSTLKWLSSDELVLEVTSRIERLEEIAPSEKNIAILGDTSLEWHLCDLAIMLSGRVVTPLYPTLTGEELAYIVSDASARIVLVENEKLFEKIKSALPEDI